MVESNIDTFSNERRFTNRPTSDRVIEALEEYLESKDSNDGRVLRDQQVTVMEDLLSFVRNHSDDLRGYVSLPTGVGKTVLFTEFVKATGLRTLVLTPTKILLHQTSDAFNKFSDPDDEITVGHIYGGRKKEEDITITTYASFVRQTQDPNGIIKPNKYDLIILDEAHRAMATGTKRALRQYNNSIQIGFTATEDYSHTRRLSSVLPHLVHKMSTGEAVESGLIAPFQNIVIKTGVDASKVRLTSTNEFDAADLEATINTLERNSMVVDVYQQYFQGQKVVIFCNGIEHSLSTAALFREAGINADAIHANLTTDEQTELKERFHSRDQAGINVLTNDRILSEGFDEPLIAAVMNISPTLSLVRAKQRSGRALRLNPDEPTKRGYVIDFVDENYARSPVLFADPLVAESSYIGGDGDSIFNDSGAQDLLKKRHGIDIISNPREVTELAHDFAEKRSKRYEVAPVGWLNNAQILALYNIGDSYLKDLLKEIDWRQSTSKEPLKAADHSGKYYVKHMPYRTKIQHYSPRIVELVAELMGVEYIKTGENPPPGWIDWSEFGRTLDPRIAKTLNDYLHHQVLLSIGNIITVNGHEYISPKAAMMLEKRKLPPENWMALLAFKEKYGATDDEVEDEYAHILDSQASARPIAWYEVDGIIQPYLPVQDAHKLERRLQKAMEVKLRQKGTQQIAKRAVTSQLKKSLKDKVTPGEKTVSLYDLFGHSQSPSQTLAKRAVYGLSSAQEVYGEDFSINL